MNFPSIWLLVLSLIASSPWVFSANVVCPRLENYTVTSMETYTEPVIVNTFTWCLQIPPRCPKTRTEMRQRYRIKTETKSRVVNECCEGYVMTSRDDAEAAVGCRPFCEKGCLSGICVSPNECQCIPGYQGDHCETACPSGTWGFQCREECNCTANMSCNPINGQCACPPGLRGQMCNESCPSDRWGPECAFLCNCENSKSKCRQDTGRCIDTNDDSFFANDTTYPRNTDEGYRVATNWTIVRLDGESSQSWKTTRLTKTAKDDREMLATTDNPTLKATSMENTSTPISVQMKIGTQAYANGNSSTVRPVIVLVSMPERRRNLDKSRGGKFTMKNPFAKHVLDHDDDNNNSNNNNNDNSNNNLHGIGSPKTDYVKNVHKDVQPTQIPLDIALIVVASIVSLGLTSVAVVMVLHMRSKLLEAARISIYEEGKSRNQENQKATKISSIVTSGSLPRSSFAVVPESRTILTTDNLGDTCCKYANGTATINLRLPGDDLHGPSLDDHYDRPSTTRIHLRNEFDADTEHVYDEIPLQSSPFGSRKNA
ncbi:uncharacterized protein LOC143427900 [Xylocopa sonorina]|uniref:uncharacterized protein LOC143427900 n=1 Tax=Xylocopa sonorina TaxID=1818115 RepID=UPI00403B223E